MPLEPFGEFLAVVLSFAHPAMASLVSELERVGEARSEAPSSFRSLAAALRSPVRAVAGVLDSGEGAVESSVRPLGRSNGLAGALVVEKEADGRCYRGNTVLTLDVAYSNARLLARPDPDWLSQEAASERPGSPSNVAQTVTPVSPSHVDAFANHLRWRSRRRRSRGNRLGRWRVGFGLHRRRRRCDLVATLARSGSSPRRTAGTAAVGLDVHTAFWLVHPLGAPEQVEHRTALLEDAAKRLAE